MLTVVLIPAYNEEARIAGAVRDARPFADAVVVVDDGSDDRTGDVARAAGAIVLRHAINRGQGAALQTATEYALDALGAEAVVHFDADGQMAGWEIPAMVAPVAAGEADVVLGSRFLGTAANMPFARRVANRLGCLFTLGFSGIALTDTHNGFRALSRDAARRVAVTIDRMAHASQILDLIVVHRLRYVERPVTITYTRETLAKSPSSLRAFGILKDVLKDKLL
jgi:glycosyltransferase involved in cell wall biosynthesis